MVIEGSVYSHILKTLIIIAPEHWVSGSSHDSSHGNHSGESNQNAEVRRFHRVTKCFFIVI